MYFERSAISAAVEIDDDGQSGCGRVASSPLSMTVSVENKRLRAPQLPEKHDQLPGVQVNHCLSQHRNAICTHVMRVGPWHLDLPAKTKERILPQASIQRVVVMDH